MVIYEYNKKKYIKKVLNKITRYYFIKWLTADSVFKKYRFNVNDAISQMGQLKMEQIKQCIFENVYFHNNLWIVYEEIKDFEEIIDLLFYLSPNNNCSPEITLLDIIRKSSVVRVTNTDIPGFFCIYPMDYNKSIYSKEEVVSSIKIFIRSYVLFALNIEKVPMNLAELYQFFINEKKPYSSAREYRVIELLLKDNYSIHDILMMAVSNDMVTPEEMFADIVKQDYKHFFRMVDNFFGSKEWVSEDKINAYIKLYDIYSHKENPQKTTELGDYILENLDEGDFDDKFKSRIRRIILRNKERCRYGI